MLKLNMEKNQYKKINKNSENVPVKHSNSRIIWCTWLSDLEVNKVG